MACYLKLQGVAFTKRLYSVDRTHTTDTAVSTRCVSARAAACARCAHARDAAAALACTSRAISPLVPLVASLLGAHAHTHIRTRTLAHSPRLCLSCSYATPRAHASFSPLPHARACSSRLSPPTRMRVRRSRARALLGRPAAHARRASRSAFFFARYSFTMPTIVPFLRVSFERTLQAQRRSGEGRRRTRRYEKEGAGGESRR